MVLIVVNVSVLVFLNPLLFSRVYSLVLIFVAYVLFRVLSQ